MGNYDPTVISPKDRVGAAPAAATSASAPDVPKVIGDFRVARLAGAGAMGEVLLATHRTSGQEVAIKIVSGRLAGDPDFVERFHTEIETLIAMDHPNVARAIAYGVHENRPWLAMEFVRGPSLSDLQKQQGALPEHVALRLAVQIARGLAHVHAKGGLVHRDIKPSNVLVGVRKGRAPDEVEHVAKIIDFGLVKSIDGQTDMGLTMPGMIVGTPFYMSPEQIGGGHVDLRGDIYSLGATLFRLLTDSPPYESTSSAVVIAKHLTEPVPDPGARTPGLHPATRALVMRTLAKKPEDRFASYEEFIGACAVALTDCIADGAPADERLTIAGVTECPVTLPILDDPTEDPFARPKTEPQLDAVVYVDTPSQRRAKPTSVSELDGGFGADRAVTPSGHHVHLAESATPPGHVATDALRRVQTRRIQRLQHEHTSRHIAAVRRADAQAAVPPWQRLLDWRTPWPWSIAGGIVLLIVALVLIAR